MQPTCQSHGSGYDPFEDDCLQEIFEIPEPNPVITILLWRIVDWGIYRYHAITRVHF